MQDGGMNRIDEYDADPPSMVSEGSHGNDGNLSDPWSIRVEAIPADWRAHGGGKCNFRRVPPNDMRLPKHRQCLESCVPQNPGPAGRTTGSSLLLSIGAVTGPEWVCEAVTIMLSAATPV